MLTLVLGGISSGKSAFAAQLAGEAGGVLVIATGRPLDPEMKSRIAAHRAHRPRAWLISEEPLDLVRAARTGPEAGTILLESVDTWIANRLEERGGVGARWSPEALAEIEAGCLSQVTPLCNRHLVAISSEVGMSMVPLNPYGRAFADVLGRVNQRLAAIADAVYLVVAGLPIRLRPPTPASPARGEEL